MRTQFYSVLLTAFLTVILFSLSAITLADTRTGLQALKRGDYRTAYSHFLPAARQGHAKAAFNVGVMHEKGYGTQQDYKKAVYWYTKAASRGERRAQYNLGHLYRQGRGVAKDMKRAVYWYQRSAKAGYSEGQYTLALRYARGEGVAQNKQQAMVWYERAARQGHATAANNLGILHHGQKNHVMAYVWVRIAADNGERNSERNVTIFRKYLSPTALNRADKIYNEYRKKYVRR